jgi:hypothetical protein
VIQGTVLADISGVAVGKQNKLPVNMVFGIKLKDGSFRSRNRNANHATFSFMDKTVTIKIKNKAQELRTQTRECHLYSELSQLDMRQKILESLTPYPEGK